MKFTSLLQAGFVLLVTASYLLVSFWTPNYAQSLLVNDKLVRIHRDSHNIPKIVAPDQQSTFYALGYVMAEDRLFQMEIKRIFVRGRLSELMGSKAVDMDKFVRDVGFHRMSLEADSLLRQKNPEVYALYQAFAAGINDQVASRILLPFEFYILWAKFEVWAPVDSIGISKLLEFSQAFDHSQEYVRSLLLKNHTKQYVDQVLPYQPKNYFTEASQVIVNDQELRDMGSFETDKPQEHFSFTPEHITKLLDVGMNQFSQWLQIGRGSNSWVVSGKLTESGRPLLANDPHLDNAMPAEWYQVKMNYTNSKGKISTFKGTMIAGCFTGLVGQAAYWGWSVTTQYADNQDLYLEKVDGNKYFFEGQWRPMQIIEEKIEVRGAQTVNHTVKLTHRGPLINMVLFPPRRFSVEEPISLAWSGSNAKIDFLESSIRFFEVDNYEELQELLKYKLDPTPNINLLYITRDDHIGYQSGGRIPIRRNIESAAYIKDGTNSHHDWIGFVDGDEKLRLTDPAKGYILTANNRPATANFRSGVYTSNNYMVMARHLRIQQLFDAQLASGKKFTVEDFKRMQLDTIDSYCVLLLPKLFQILPEIKNSLGSWDCDMPSKSAEAALYNVFLGELERKLKPLEILPFQGYIPFAHYVYRYINSCTEDTKCAKTIQEAWGTTFTFLKGHFGNEDSTSWEWGKLHLDALPHRVFNKIPLLRDVYDRYIPGFGNENTVNVGRMGKGIDDDYSTYHRANLRIIQSFVEGESQWIIDSGSSESIFSSNQHFALDFAMIGHYDDQLKVFSKEQYLDMDTKPDQTPKDNSQEEM